MRIVTETPRLILRELEIDDLPALISLRSDPRVMRYSLSGPQTPEQVAHYLEQCRKRYDDWGYGLWAVQLRGSVPLPPREGPGECRRQIRQATVGEQTNAMGPFIGACGLMRAHFDNHWEPEVGYRLLPEFWGKGLATEAAAAVRDLGFEQYRFDHLIAMIDPGNAASFRVAAKIGMKPRRKDVYKGSPVEIYSMNRPE